MLVKSEQNSMFPTTRILSCLEYNKKKWLSVDAILENISSVAETIVWC